MIRIMTHNVWNKDKNSSAWEEKGHDCSAYARVGGHIRVYKETLPDIIGGQEFSSLMADLIKEGLSAENMNYTLIWGRFTPILYRSDKFELVENEFFTYPEFIDRYEGSFNDVKSKAFNIAVFREKQSQKLFIFATTHLWWKRSPDAESFAQSDDRQAFSDEAREYQIALLIKKALQLREKYACPAILVGDFNTDYDSKAVKYALSQGFSHAHDIATDFADETVGYHNCFSWGFEEKYFDTPFEKAIDHIFVIGEKDGAVKNFVRYSPDYYFPISDHSAAYIDFEL